MKKTKSFEPEIMLTRFARYRGENPKKTLREFVDSESISDTATLAALIVQEIQNRYTDGSQEPVAVYFQWFPELHGDATSVQSILNSDFRGQFSAGLCHDISGYRTGDARLDQMFNRQAGPDSSSRRPALSTGGDSKFRRQSLVGCTYRNYRIDEILNAGRRSTVYKAADQNLKRTVVLKVSDHPGEAAGREARFLARLEHPNILPIHDEFEMDGRLFIVTSYVDGDSLARLTGRWFEGTTLDNPHIEKQYGGLAGRTRLLAVVELVRRIASAIRHAHNHGVLHCDIKPGNVLIEPSGNPRLMDFDIALNADSTDESLGGTVGYMSPEQSNFFTNKSADARRIIDHRSDIYSMGVVFYELLTGELPDRSSTSGKLANALNALPGSTRSLTSIVVKCLGPLPDDRYQSAGELEKDILAWQEGRPLAYATDSWLPEQALRYARRHPVVVSLGVVMMLLVTTGLLRSWLEIRTVEKTMTSLENQVTKANSGDVPGLAARLLETRAVIRGATPWNWFYSTRRQHAAARLQIILWKLAQREDQLLSSYAVVRPAIGATGDLVGNAEDFYRLVAGTTEVADNSFSREFAGVRQRGWIALLSQSDVFSNSDTSRFVATVFPSLAEQHRQRIAKLRTGSVAELLTALDLGSSVSAGQRNAVTHDQTMLQDIEWHLLGVKFHLQENSVAARTCFRNAIEIRMANNLIPWIQSVRYMANTCLHDNDYEQAAKYLEMAVMLENDQHELWGRLGLVKEVLGARNEAIRCLQTAIAISPESADYHADLGTLFVRNQQVDVAQKYLNEATRLGSLRRDIKLNRAIAVYLSGDVDGAIKKLTQLVESSPDYKPAADLLGELESRRDQTP